MDSVVGVLVPGILGGLLVAYLLSRIQRPSQFLSGDPFPGRTGTDVINMAHIRVAGVGGLGLVAMCLAVAVWVPRIRQSLAISLGLGVVLAVVLILRRRKTGPMPSSGRSAGANTMLSIDDAGGQTAESKFEVRGSKFEDRTALPVINFP